MGIGQWTILSVIERKKQGNQNFNIIFGFVVNLRTVEIHDTVTLSPERNKEESKGGWKKGKRNIQWREREGDKERKEGKKNKEREQIN